ncbi:MAG TPA: deoxyribodipyrimidine photo-lyase, partial [Candidatus Binatia bacterium]|nr:deoxyribodipyrimidine photo-lyase [Candidatus Binatia bacterium]
MTIVVLFNRDLRVHDHPALAAARRDGDAVVPLFVLDTGILERAFGRPNRVRFLLDGLHDLRAALERRGGTLVVRRGAVVAETMRVVEETGAGAIYASDDPGPYARRRAAALGSACRRTGRTLRLFPGTTVVPPGAIRTGDGRHFERFTPYWRRWRAHPGRRLEPPPRSVRVPATIAPGDLPEP